MSNRIIRGACSVAIAAGVALSGAAGLRAEMQAAPAPASGPVRTANVLPGLGLLTPLGLPSPLTEMRVGIGLAPSDPTGERALFDALYDPASPLYHHFLSPAEVADRFGVPASRYQAVESWLRSGGLSITHTDSARTYVQASGTAAQLDRLFATTLRTYRSKGVGFVANDRPRRSRPAWGSSR